jgi:hypothetical protein
MLAAAVVLLGSVAAAALVPAGRVLVVPVPVPHEAELPVLVQVPPGRGGLVLARVPPEPVLLHLLPLLLPQVVVESEVPLHLQGRQSFSAAMARSSPPTVQPTYERAPSTRSPPKGRPCPSACRNWMPVRG